MKASSDMMNSSDFSIGFPAVSSLVGPRLAKPPPTCWLTSTALAITARLGPTDRVHRHPELARCEINAFRYRVLHVAARITRGARQLRLRIDATWRWAAAIATAWQRLRAAFPDRRNTCPANPKDPPAIGQPAHPGDTGGPNTPKPKIAAVQRFPWHSLAGPTGMQNRG